MFSASNSVTIFGGEKGFFIAPECLFGYMRLQLSEQKKISAKAEFSMVKIRGGEKEGRIGVNGVPKMDVIKMR